MRNELRRRAGHRHLPPARVRGRGRDPPPHRRRDGARRDLLPAASTSPRPASSCGDVGRAVDLGANIGLFGAWLLGRCPDAEVVAYEADPANAAVHRLAIEANGLEERWRLVEAFAGTQEGTTRFTTGLHAVSHEGEGIEVPVVDVLPELADADLVKIDIEGAEWPILADSRFRELQARLVVLEYHAEGSPQPDPAAAAEQALTGAGYEVHHAGRKPAFGAGLLWGVRR